MSAPVLSWDAVLNLTKIELELISDPDMYLFFEKGMRGGVSYIYKRYNKVNSNYLELKHVIYLDANNLYGYAMSKFLPTDRFK